MVAIVDGGRTPALPPGFTHAWGLAPPANRPGPKPAHTVGQIVDAAVRLADAAGFAALSMPRIAKQLGLTAPALYRYVNSKDELLVLVNDTAWGPPPDAVRTATHWRDGAGAWTRAVVDRFRARPWLLDIPVRGAPVTPNLCRWLEALLVALAGTGLADEDLLGCAVLLDGYARSTASLLHGLAGNAGPPVQSPAVAEPLHRLLHAQDCPTLAGMLARGSYQDDLPDGGGEDIEFGLDRLLDGIEALVTADS